MVSSFSRGVQVMAVLVDVRLVSPALGSTVISTSSRWYIQDTVMTSWEMVAENRPRFFRFLTFSMMPGHVLEKAHVQHPVRLVQHHGLDLVQPQGLAVVVVHEPARGGHHDLGLFRKLLGSGRRCWRRRRVTATRMPLQ